MRSVTYVGVDGSVWPLTTVDHDGVFLQATPSDLTVEDEKLSGSLDLVVADHSPDGVELGELSEIESRWRRAWSTRQYGTLRVGDERRPSAWLRVRLSAPIPAFPDFGADGYQDFSQSVVAEGDSWFRTYEFPDPAVTVVNGGDVDGWVRIRWQEGGKVILPSGASFTLPEVAAPRTIVLDPRESCVVLDDDGNIDRSVWKSLRGSVFPEMIPPGEQRVFTIPNDSMLLFDEGVMSPW